MRIQLDTIDDSRRQEAEKLSQAQQAFWGWIGTEAADADSHPQLTKKKLIDAIKILGIDTASIPVLIAKTRRVANNLATYNASAVAVKSEEHRVLFEKNKARIEKLNEQIEKLTAEVRTANSALNRAREYAEQALTDAGVVAREMIDAGCPSNMLPKALDTAVRPRLVIATGDTQIIDVKRRRGEVFFVVGAQDPSRAITYNGDKKAGQFDLDFLGGDLRPAHAELGYDATVVEHADADMDADHEKLGNAPRHAPNADKAYAPDPRDGSTPHPSRTPSSHAPQPVPIEEPSVPPPSPYLVTPDNPTPHLRPSHVPADVAAKYGVQTRPQGERYQPQQTVQHARDGVIPSDMPTLFKRDRHGNMVAVDTATPPGDVFRSNAVISAAQTPRPGNEPQPGPQKPVFSEEAEPAPQPVADMPPELANPGAIDPDAVIAEFAPQAPTEAPESDLTGLEDPATGLLPDTTPDA